MPKDAHYKMEKIGDKTTFTVAPVPYPVSFGFPAVLSIVGLVGLALAVTSFVWILLAVGAFGLAFVLIRADFKRRPKRLNFAVSSKEIEVGSKTIPVETLHALYMRNSVSKAEQSVDTSYLAMTSAMVAGGSYATSSIGAMHLARAATAAKKKQKLADISWRIDAEVSGVAITLAHGLEEITARGIVTDVQRCMSQVA